MKQSSNLNFIDSIKKLGRIVEINELNDSDINEIICHKYPKFTSNTKSKIVENVLEAIKSLGDFSTTRAIRGGYRNLSLRDLLKLFDRLNSINDAEDRKTVLLILNDVYDLFLSWIQDKQTRLEFAVNIGAKFNINREEVLNLIVSNKPNFEKQRNSVICGRVKLWTKKFNTKSLNQSSLL